MFCLLLNFFVCITSKPVPPRSQLDSNLLYDDNKYAKRNYDMYIFKLKQNSYKKVKIQKLTENCSSLNQSQDKFAVSRSVTILVENDPNVTGYFYMRSTNYFFN